MQAVTNALFSRTAEDLMSREVLTLAQDMPLRDAAWVLTQARVSGAPVVDARGRCVGVFSTADFLRRTRSRNRAAPVAPPVPGCVCSDWELIDGDDGGRWPEDTVGQYMATDPALVSPATPLGDLVEMMVDAHVHQLIVADEDRHPLGIVSGTDVLAAVALAARAEAASSCGR